MPIICLYLMAIFSTIYPKFFFASKDAGIQLEQNAKLLLGRDLENFSGTLRIPNTDAGSIVSVGGKYSVKFKNGTLRRGNNKVVFSGDFDSGYVMEPGGALVKTTRADSDATQPNRIFLRGEQVLTFDDIVVNEIIEVQGAGNKISGKPKFANPITLLDQDTQLHLDLTSKLTNSIQLNGGQIILEDDLYLKDNTWFQGDGKINIASFSLCLPSNKGTPYTNNLTFIDANDIQLNGYTELVGTWTFSGDGGLSTLKGNGNVLDISQGGQIVVGPNQTLDISALIIKGLGGTQGGNIIIDPTSIVRLSTTTLSLDGNWPLMSGTISVISPDCKMLIHDRHYWVLYPGSTLIIDGVVFYYSIIDNAPIYPPPFYPMPGSNLSMINGGQIDCPEFRTFSGANEFGVSEDDGINILTGGVDMNSRTIVHFVNDNPSQFKKMIFDGGGYRVRYDVSNPGSVIVDENVLLNIRNMVVHLLNFRKITLHGSGATKARYFFSDGVILHLGEDLILENDITLDIRGDAILDCNSRQVKLNGSEKLLISGANKTCTIRNAYLSLNAPDSIKISDDTTTLLLQDVVVSLEGPSWNFSQGNLAFQNKCTIAGLSTVWGAEGLNFTSKGLMTILPISELKFANNVRFTYAPDISGDANAAAYKRHLVFTDASAAINFKNNLWQIFEHGIALDRGIMRVTEKIVIDLMSTSTDCNFEVYNGTLIAVSGTAIFDINGPIVYQASV